jgi:hypothetical protein
MQVPSGPDFLLIYPSILALFLLKKRKRALLREKGLKKREKGLF